MELASCYVVLRMHISAACVAIHMQTDANHIVTSASIARLPEQKETIHMIQMLRKEACSGQKILHTLSQLTVCLFVSLSRRPKLMHLSKLFQQVFSIISICIHHLDHC